MSRPYAIAQYLNATQKARACRAVYGPTRPRHPTWPCPRTADGACPLGMALGSGGSPGSGSVGTLLAAADPFISWRAAWRAAYAFIVAWDHGAVTPPALPAALGWAPEPTDNLEGVCP